MREKREFNFALSWEQVQRKPRSRLLGLERNVFLGIAGTAVLALGLALTPWLWEYKLQADLTQINGKISQLSQVDRLWQEVKSLQKQVQNQTDLLSLMQKNSSDPGALWNKLGQYLPPGTVINSFAFESGNTLKLTISVPTPIELAQLWVNLRDSNLFENIDIQTVSLEDKVQTLNLNLKLK